MKPPETKSRPGGRAALQGDHQGSGIKVNGSPSPGPYATAGLVLFKLGWPGPIPVVGKFPPTTGWTGAKGEWPSYADVYTWDQDRGGQNVALRLPRDVLGIDVDHYD